MPVDTAENEISVRDLTASSRHSCLYVYDQANNIIWKMTDLRSHQVHSWLECTGQNYANKLSITAEGDVLLSVQSTLVDPSKLNIYGKDANLLQSITLPTDIGDPCHVVEVGLPSRPNTFLIFSRICLPPAGKIYEYKICEFDYINGLVRKYMQLGKPKSYRNSHLAFVRQGRVGLYITTRSKLIMLDAVLSTQEVVLEGDDKSYNYPRRVVYYEDSSSSTSETDTKLEEDERLMDKKPEAAGWLIVGHVSGRVEVFEVTHVPDFSSSSEASG